MRSRPSSPHSKSKSPRSSGSGNLNRSRPPQRSTGNSNPSRSSAGRGEQGFLGPRGAIYKPNYLDSQETQKMLNYLLSLQPIWEMRFSKNNPPAPHQTQRSLLRPVYWLGNWQFACLNYYHPPKGLLNRCMRAEPYPDFMQRIVDDIEAQVHSHFLPKDIPRGWKLNTCLVNYYGDRIEADGKKNDCARVGEHKDFEPGPVASISFGEKALFQFVSSKSPHLPSKVESQQWLEDRSLQIFGGDRFKKNLFHRVQRVDRKENSFFPLKNIDDFKTRRINLTFRYVPEEHIHDFHELSLAAKEDVQGYVEQLALSSDFFKEQLGN